MTAPRPMPALPAIAAQRVNGILLQGHALVAVAQLVKVGIRSAWRDDGITPSPRLRQLADLLADAARDTAASGHPFVGAGLTPASSSLDEITTTEGAAMLGVSKRQMRRIAPLLGGRHAAAGWLVRRGAVAAYRHEGGTEA